MNISSFAFNLFSALSAYLSGEDSNILISPYSIASALSLVLAGATIGSQCQQELQSVLNISSHEDISTLTQSLTQSSAFTSATGIWSRDLKQSYIDVVQRTYRAEASELPRTYEPIDAYIKNKTNGLIYDMLEGPVDPSTVAVLVNAVHFKSDWTIPFEKNLTSAGQFTSTHGQKKEAMFMKATRNMNFAADVELLRGASIVQLDYGEVDASKRDEDDEFAAFFILPSREGEGGINDVIQSLADQSFDTVLDQMSSWRKVALSIPRFRFSYGTKSIKAELKSIGISACFEDEMLLEMSEDPSVRLNEVLHKAAIEVTEEGTEAAAATVVVMYGGAMPRPPVTLTFDRPFIMLILHRPSMSPLFLARVDDPDLTS
jgi:serine protease inhibitor